MADETEPNPRVAHIEAEIARTREKHDAAIRRVSEANERVADLETQIVGLEYQLEQELGKAAPAPPPAPREE